MVSFVKNYFLEYDGHDDEPKPYLGFFFQSTGMGLILSLVTYLCAQLVRTAAFPDAPMFEGAALYRCFNIAAIVCLIGNMSAVIYLMVLFWRDEHDLNTSGTAMNVIAVMISCVAYCIARCCSPCRSWGRWSRAKYQAKGEHQAKVDHRGYLWRYGPWPAGGAFGK